MMIRALLMIGLLGLLLFSPAFAEEPAAAPAAEAQVSYPGPGEVAPQATQLENDAIQLEAEAVALSQLGDFKKQFNLLQQQLQELQTGAAGAGPLDEWFSSRLLDFKGNIEQHRGQVEKLLQSLSERVNQLTGLQQEWKSRLEYWAAWKTQLETDQQTFSTEVFDRVEQKIKQAQQELDKTAAPLLKAQDQLLAHQVQVLALQKQFDTALNNLKGKLFKKNARSLISESFWAELKAVHWGRGERSAVALMGLDQSFLRQNLGLLIAQLFCALLLGGAILRYRRQLAKTSEWHFICNHPLATGVFAAVPLFSLFYIAPPPLWQLLQGVVGVFSATILISATVANPYRKTVVYLVATIFSLSLILKILSFPALYYRLYLTVLSLLGMFWLWWYGQRNRKARRQMTSLTVYLRLGASLFFIALICQFAGYVSLATLLLEAAIESIIVLLFVNMACRLSSGAVDYLLGLPIYAKLSFIQSHRDGLAVPLKRILRFFFYAYALIYLLTVWQVFATVPEAWQAVLGFKVVFGEFSFSVEMAVLVGLVLYLTIFLSWLLRALLDDQYFPRHGFDRGVRDSIKTLLHYSLLLIGFLFAISLAGIELRNFAVLAGAFGIGIGFGLQDIVNNFVSGLILLFERPIKVGDGVMIDGEYGTVAKIGMRSTIVETLDQSELIVPNSQMISQKVTNWTLSTRRVRLVIPVGVAYGSDLELVLGILKNAGAEHPEVLDNPAPSPIFVQFGESSLDFELRVWISDVANRPRIRSEILQYIDKLFREAKVEIPFPQRDLHLRSISPGTLSELDSSKPPSNPDGAEA